MKSTEQLAAFHQGNVAAVVASGQIVSSGMQDVSQHLVRTAQSAMAETLSVWRAMAGVGSIQEALALQSSFVRAAIEKGMTDTSRLAESGMRLAEQAAAPIAARMGAAVEVFSQG